jgi:hypothetical protein
MAEGEIPDEGIDAADNSASRPDGVFDAPLNRQTRGAMLVTSLLLGLGTITSLGFFGYQLYRFLMTGGAYAPTTVPWPNVVGHFIRAVGLALLCLQLAILGFNIDANTGALSNSFAKLHRNLWRTVPCVLLVLAAFTVFETTYMSKRDVYDYFFRPEYQSGYVLLKPGRVEVRRASEAPVDRWVKKTVHSTSKELFVAPEPEITGSDIHRVMVRVWEVDPGRQVAEVQIQFTKEGKEKMNKLIQSHLAGRFAFFFDGELRSAPWVFSPISGDPILTNVFTPEEAASMIRQGSDQ